MDTSYAIDIEQLLEAGHTIRIKPEGYSMYPLFVPGRDAALIEKVPIDRLKKGDVVLYRRDGSILVLHRICRIAPEGFYMVGDNQSVVEGPLRPDQIKGKMIAFERKKKRPVTVDNIFYRMVSGIWLGILPMRPIFFAISAGIKKCYKVLIVMLIIMALLLFYWNWRGKAVYTPETFSISDEVISNPYIGFYTLTGITLSDETQPELPEAADDSSQEGIVLLEVNLKQYKDRDLSEQALHELQTVFSAYRDNGNQLIVRFLYDWNGKNLETEPESLNQILKHMSQTAEIVNAYKDTIYILQGLFIGDCGEMHHSKYADAEDMKVLAEHLASVTDPSIYMAVRTPAQLRSILGTDSLPDEEALRNGTLSARLGLFNDGMLGSGNDVGTYGEKSRNEADVTSAWTRADEIAFQNELCQVVPNGGEVIQDNLYNDLENAVTDLNAMHVSYLNKDYDTNVYDKWRQGTYEGQNGYDYIAAHLGYRYSLKSSEYVSGKWRKTKGTLKVQVENSGFSCSYRSFDVRVQVVSQEGEVCQDLVCDIDTKLWQAGETTDLSVPVDFGSLPSGSYELYFSVSDPWLDRQITLANQLTQNEWGYFIGKLDL